MAGGYVWVAYQKKKPHLPIAVADTARELAKILGGPYSSIESYVCKYRRGMINTEHPLYMRVYIDEED